MPTGPLHTWTMTFGEFLKTWDIRKDDYGSFPWGAYRGDTRFLLHKSGKSLSVHPGLPPVPDVARCFKTKKEVVSALRYTWGEVVRRAHARGLKVRPEILAEAGVEEPYRKESNADNQNPV